MDKQTYRALPGVDWVNGVRVPKNRQVQLTEAEARYDLDHGRIETVPAPEQSSAAHGAQAADAKPTGKSKA